MPGNKGIRLRVIWERGKWL